MKKHIHYKEIVAWAKGKKIQVKLMTDNTWVDEEFPKWHLNLIYRVKPKDI